MTRIKTIAIAIIAILVVNPAYADVADVVNKSYNKSTTKKVEVTKQKRQNHRREFSKVPILNIIEEVAYGISDVLETASRYQGLSEHKDRAKLKQVVKVDPVTTPWCGAFVNGVLQQRGKKGSGSQTASSFLSYGTPTKNPSPGDIAVLNHHVGFVKNIVNKNGRRYVAVLGGNQSNKVTTTYYPVSSIISFRKAT